MNSLKHNIVKVLPNNYMICDAFVCCFSYHWLSYYWFSHQGSGTQYAVSQILQMLSSSQGLSQLKFSLCGSDDSDLCCLISCFWMSCLTNHKLFYLTKCFSERNLIEMTCIICISLAISVCVMQTISTPLASEWLVFRFSSRWHTAVDFLSLNFSHPS